MIDIEYFNGVLDEMSIDNFSSEKNFIDIQSKRIDNLTLEEITFCHILIKMINNGNIVATESDAYNHLHPNGFFFYTTQNYIN